MPLGNKSLLICSIKRLKGKIFLNANPMALHGAMKVHNAILLTLD